MNYVLSERSARWLKTQMAKSAGYNPAEAATTRLVRRDAASAPRAPLPYEVRRILVPVTQGGSTTNVRRWCIYLPGEVLYIDRDDVDVTEDLTEAQGVSGWYELSSFSSGTVYLHITLPYDEETESASGSGTGSGTSGSASGSGSAEHHDAEAEIVTTRSTPGDHDFYVTVARVASDGKVTQFVVGSIVLGSGSGGGSSASGAFAFSGGVIGVGAVTVGRQAYKVNEDGTEVESDYTGDYRVSVELDEYGGDPTIEVEEGDGFDPPNGNTSYFPLYTFENGRVTDDWRGTFVVPVWEMSGGYSGGPGQ